MSGARHSEQCGWNRPASAGEVPALRHCVAGFAARAGLGGTGLADLELAVTEAMTNVVVHAYEDLAPGLLNVTAAHVDGHVDVTIRDHGVGMRPRADSPGLGLGLGLIAALAGKSRITQTPGGGTTVWMRFAR